MTLQQAVDAYLGDRDLKPRTVKDVRVIMPRYFADWLRLPITDIRPAMIEDRYAKLVEGKASGAAAKLAMRYLRSILNYASAKFGDDDKPLLTTNPVKRLSVTRKGWTAGKRRRTLGEARRPQGVVRGGAGAPAACLSPPRRATAC